MSRSNIRIDPTLDVDIFWKPTCVLAYIETWFDVEEKFGISVRDNDAWVNLYAMYDPRGRTIEFEYYIHTDNSVSEAIPYIATQIEQYLVMDMIEEKCREIDRCSCAELLG